MLGGKSAGLKGLRNKGSILYYRKKKELIKYTLAEVYKDYKERFIKYCY